jgi:hypothetical protein
VEKFFHDEVVKCANNLLNVPMNEMSVTIITPECPLCFEGGTITVNADQWQKYANGSALVQDAFPDMTPDDREMLISGTHASCWEVLWIDEEES